MDTWSWSLSQYLRAAHEETDRCIYVCTHKVSGRGFNKSRSISNQHVSVIRYQAEPTSRSHITEICCPAPQTPTLCICFIAGRCPANWIILKITCFEKKTPEASIQPKTNKNLQHRCSMHWFPGDTTPSYVEHVDLVTRISGLVEILTLSEYTLTLLTQINQLCQPWSPTVVQTCTGKPTDKPMR